MTVLSSRDAIQLLEIACELNAPCTLDEFPHRVMALLPRLVRSDHTAYNEVNLQRGRIIGFMEPDQASVEEITTLLQPHLATHPLISHVARTGDATPVAISDFWSQSTYHGSALYHECYRCLQVEDQLALPFGPTPGVLLAVTLNRSRRNFSDRDRAVLTRLRPHLTQAYLCATQITLLHNEVARRGALWDAMACGALLICPRGTITFCSDKAARWLSCYCGSEAFRQGEAPAPLRAWLGRCRADPLGAAPLRIARGDAVLVVRLGGNTPDGTLILLDEHAAHASSDLLPDALRALQNLGLTRRQSEVLLWLSRGESNGQIAARLDLSLHTIKHHLEAIFGRLGVQSRSAAAHRAQQALRESSSI